MQINRHFLIPLEGFSEVSPIMGVPRGDLFKFGINPFNGNVVMCFQDNPTARFYIRLFMAQLAKYPDMFDEAAIAAYHAGDIDGGDMESVPMVEFAEVV